MKLKNVVLALAVGIMVCLLVVTPFIQATTPIVVTSDNLLIKDSLGNVIGIAGLNTTILYCTAIDQLTSGQGVKLYRLVVENGSSFPSSPVDKQVFYHTGTDLLYVYDTSSWNPVGAAPTSYPYANVTGVPDLSSVLVQNGSKPLLNNWNTGSYGIYGLTYVSTVGTVYCSGLSNQAVNGYVNTTRLLVETSATAPSLPGLGYVYFDTAQNNLFIYNGTGWMPLGNATTPTIPDLTVYLFDNGTRPLTANWNVGSYGLYGVTWVNTTSLNIASQLWWNGFNRTDIIAHPQDSFNFLVYSEGGVSYARTGNTWQVTPSTIQACVDAVTASGGSIIVKNGTYSEAVSLKNATRLVLDRGCVGVTVTVASGATAILEDYNLAITWVWSSGVLVMQYNNINGLITGIYANFLQYWSGAYNRTDSVVNPYGPYSYIIDLSGSTYRMRNGTTGQIDFGSTNLTLVEQFANGNLTSGLIYLKEVVWNTALGMPGDNVMVVQSYLGELRYISASSKFVIPQLVSDPNTTGWTQTEQGRMWFNTAADVMKYWNGSAIVIFPSIGGGSSLSYTLPFSYTVYKSGSTYFAESSTGTLLDSSTNGMTVLQAAVDNMPEYAIADFDRAPGVIYIKPPFSASGTLNLNRSGVTIDSGIIEHSYSVLTPPSVYIQRIMMNCTNHNINGITLKGLMVQEWYITGNNASNSIGSIKWVDSVIFAENAADKRGVIAYRTGSVPANMPCIDTTEFVNVVFRQWTQTVGYGMFTDYSFSMGLFNFYDCLFDMTEDNQMIFNSKDGGSIGAFKLVDCELPWGSYDNITLINIESSATSWTGCGSYYFYGGFWEVGANWTLVRMEPNTGTYGAYLDVLFSGVTFDLYGGSTTTLLNIQNTNWLAGMHNSVTFVGCEYLSSGVIVAGTWTESPDFHVSIDIKGYNYGSDSSVSYIIQSDGTNYYATKTLTGETYSSTNGIDVLQAAQNNLTAGGTIIVKVPFTTTGTLNITNSGVTIDSGISHFNYDGDYAAIRRIVFNVSGSAVSLEDVTIRGFYVNEVDFDVSTANSGRGLADLNIVDCCIESLNTVGRRGIVFNSTAAADPWIEKVNFDKCRFFQSSYEVDYGAITVQYGNGIGLINFDDCFWEATTSGSQAFSFVSVWSDANFGYVSFTDFVSYAGGENLCFWNQTADAGSVWMRMTGGFFEMSNNITIMKIADSSSDKFVSAIFDGVIFDVYGGSTTTLLTNDCTHWSSALLNCSSLIFDGCTKMSTGSLVMGTPNTNANFQVSIDIAGVGATASYGGYSWISSANTTATTSVLDHGLLGTPNFVLCSFNFTGWNSWTWTATSTQITITVTGTLPASYTVYVYAKYVP